MKVLFLIKRIVKFFIPYGILKIYKIYKNENKTLEKTVKTCDKIRKYIDYKIKELSNENLNLKALIYNSFLHKENCYNIKVSIIIPVYMMEKYIGECLESILKQTLKEIEIIIINDGSTDASLTIIEEFARKDSRIKVLNQNNCGAGVSRNIGIKMAKGEFVCFLDADDVYPDADVLECLYICAKIYKVDICGGEFSYFDSNSKIFKQDFDKSVDGYLFDRPKLIAYSEYQFDYGYHRFLYKREKLIEKNIYFPNLSRFQDPPFFINAMLSANTFYAINKNVYGYRTRHRKVEWTNKKIEDFLAGINYDIDISLQNGYKKLLNYSYLHLIQHLNEFKNINYSLKNKEKISKTLKKFNEIKINL